MGPKIDKACALKQVFSLLAVTCVFAIRRKWFQGRRWASVDSCVHITAHFFVKVNELADEADAAIQSCDQQIRLLYISWKSSSLCPAGACAVFVQLFHLYEHRYRHYVDETAPCSVCHLSPFARRSISKEIHRDIIPVRFLETYKLSIATSSRSTNR